MANEKRLQLPDRLPLVRLRSEGTISGTRHGILGNWTGVSKKQEMVYSNVSVSVLISEVSVSSVSSSVLSYHSRYFPTEYSVTG